MSALRARLQAEAFKPGWLGFVLSPVFIIRRGLYLAISRSAPELRGRILDFGCGSKPYEPLFVNADCYVGCDIQVSGHVHSDSRVDVFYDGKRLPFGDRCFDAVVSFETFEHVFNLPTVLAEINRVTRADGHLLISLPFAWGEHEEPYDFARYTSFGIDSVLRDAGYEVRSSIKTTSYLLAVFQLLIAYVSSQLAPRGWRHYVVQLLVVFPLTLLAHLLNAILPKRDQFFCNLVVLARKVR